MPQFASRLQFPIDHVIAKQHGGMTTVENLALCCGRCNRHKGPNLAGIDPGSGVMTRLFNPRLDAWTDHFGFEKATIVGSTDVGRTTVVVLAMNLPQEVVARQTLLDVGHQFI